MVKYNVTLDGRLLAETDSLEAVAEFCCLDPAEIEAAIEVDGHCNALDASLKRELEITVADDIGADNGKTEIPPAPLG